jgi:hypothetical protein
MSEVTWISVTDAAYKLGKKRVIDLAVLRAFFEAKKAEGLSRLAKSMNG